MGSFKKELNAYSQKARLIAPVVGALIEMPLYIYAIADRVSSVLANEQILLLADKLLEAKGKFTQPLCYSLRLAAHFDWAPLLVDFVFLPKFG
jgi:hypothetical protein